MAPDLDIAIRRALDRWTGNPIRWGKDDCLMGLAEIVREWTGKDFGKPFRGRYRSRHGAIRVLGARGVPGAIRNAATALRFKRKAPSEARPGSLGYILSPEGPAGVIKHGAFWIGRVDNGFSALPDESVVKAWSP